jgi:hypothetical protein
MNQISRMSRYLLSLVSRGKGGREITSAPSLGNQRVNKIVGEGLLSATGHHAEAMILQRFLYWTGRLWDFDQFMYEERVRREREIQDEPPESGWVGKTEDDLFRDLMPTASERAIRKHLKSLVRKGFLFEREDPEYSWEHTLQYRMNFVKLQRAMARRGYPLDECIFGQVTQMIGSDRGNLLQDN